MFFYLCHFDMDGNDKRNDKNDVAIVFICNRLVCTTFHIFLVQGIVLVLYRAGNGCIVLAVVDGRAVRAGIQPEPAEQPYHQVPREAPYQNHPQGGQIRQDSREEVSIFYLVF